MKAIIYEKYGPPEVLQLEEVEKPVPGDGDILVKVHATTVNYGDLSARDFKNISSRSFNMPYIFWILSKFVFGLQKPRLRILGNEFSGVIESTGKDVKQFKAGDAVFGYLGQNMGTYAEYVCMSENGTVSIKPGNIGFAESAVLPMGTIMAWPLLKKAELKPGQKVLINGASGSIGSAAVQIARHHYDAQVTGVCGTARVGFVRSLGADKVVDYKREDFTQNGESYDLVFDVLGKTSFSKSKKILNENGIHLYASFKLKQLLQMAWTSIFGNKKVICAIAPGSKEDLLAVRDLIEGGKIKAIIDRSFTLVETADAHSYVENGMKQGHVVIAVGDQNQS